MLLFLDIDGVMVPTKSWKPAEVLGDGLPMFSKKATRALQYLLTDGTTIVLTTAHRLRFTIDEWKQLFKNRGLDVQRIISLGENINNLNRRDEIVRWFILTDPKEDFIILDDDTSLNDLPEYLKSNLVLTSTMIGLTEELIEQRSFNKAIELEVA